MALSMSSRRMPQIRDPLLDLLRAGLGLLAALFEGLRLLDLDFTRSLLLEGLRRLLDLERLPLDRLLLEGDRFLHDLERLLALHDLDRLLLRDFERFFVLPRRDFEGLRLFRRRLGDRLFRAGCELELELFRFFAFRRGADADEEDLLLLLFCGTALERLRDFEPLGAFGLSSRFSLPGSSLAGISLATLASALTSAAESLSSFGFFDLPLTLAVSFAFDLLSSLVFSLLALPIFSGFSFLLAFSLASTTALAFSLPLDFLAARTEDAEDADGALAAFFGAAAALPDEALRAMAPRRRPAEALGTTSLACACRQRMPTRNNPRARMALSAPNLQPELLHRRPWKCRT